MKKILFAGLLFFSVPVWAQAPYTDTTCDLSQQICSGLTYSYSAWTGNHPSQAGPFYGCLTTQPNPAWFYFIGGSPGTLQIKIYSTPTKDIDFITWGPYNSLSEACNGGLDSVRKIDCSYLSAGTEYADYPLIISGKYYVLLITNFSKTSCMISLLQSAGTGNMLCLTAPQVNNNSPLCPGDTLKLSAVALPGASYHWSGPNNFTSTVQNPVIPDASQQNAGTYSVYLSMYGIDGPSSSTTVSIKTPPIVDLDPAFPLCVGDSVAIGDSSQTGYSYSWSSNPTGFASVQANPLVSPGVTTWYYLTVTSQGCSRYDSTQVLVNPLPLAFTGPDTSICAGGEVSLGGPQNNGSSYSWSSSPIGFSSTQADPSFIPSETTVFHLTETFTTTGCLHTDSVKVTVHQLPVANAGSSSTICLGDTAWIGGISANNCTYEWISNPSGYSSNMANPYVYPSYTTIYHLNVYDTTTGCSNNSEVTVTVNPLPVFSIIQNSAICTGQSIVLAGQANPDYLYSWTSIPAGFASTEASPSVSPILTTTYSATVTNNLSSCHTHGSVTVTVNPLPVVTVAPSSTICTNAASSLGGPSQTGHLYSWTSDPAGFFSTLANPSDNPQVNTVYTLVQTIQATACINTGQVSVSVLPLPQAVTGPPQTICSGSMVSLGAQPVGNNTYYWVSIPPGYSSSISNPQVYPTQTTTFTLTETIPLTGCNKSNSVVITVNPQPIVSLAPFQPLCKDAPPLNLTGGSPSGGTYSGPGVSNGLFYPTNTGPGIFNIIYSYVNPQGCSKAAFQPIHVLNKPKISGLVKYDNTSGTGLDSCCVILLNIAGQAIDSVQTTGQGAFAFPCRENGTFMLQLKTSKQWKGVNFTDALLLARYSVGLIGLSPIRFIAGDVNLSNSINGADALLVCRRWAGLITSFPAGDWYFDLPGPFTLQNQDITINITGICYGDVNGSY